MKVFVVVFLYFWWKKPCGRYKGFFSCFSVFWWKKPCGRLATFTVLSLHEFHYTYDKCSQKRPPCFFHQKPEKQLQKPLGGGRNTHRFP